MRVVVCLKQVPEETGPLPFLHDGAPRPDVELSWTLSTLDRYALEAGLQLREGHGGELVALHVGPDHAPSVLTEALALGADSAAHVWDDALARLDSLGTARVLAVGIRALMPVDLVLAGQRGVDTDCGHVPAMLAELLDLPLVSGVVGLALEGEHVRLQREVDGRRETCETPLPAVLSARKGLNEPRRASIKGIIGAKRKPRRQLGLAELNLVPEDLQPRTQVLETRAAPPRPPARFIAGEAETQALELLRILREEIRIP